MLKLKAILKRRYADVIDRHHGISLLTQHKQRHETVGTYCDKYTEAAEKSK